MAEAPTNPRSSRRLAWGIGLLALAMSVMTVLQVHRYGETRPTMADLAQGRTHAVKIHSKIVYLTAGEFGASVTSHVMAVAAIAAFLGLLLKSRSSKPHGSQQS